MKTVIKPLIKTSFFTNGDPSHFYKKERVARRCRCRVNISTLAFIFFEINMMSAPIFFPLLALHKLDMDQSWRYANGENKRIKMRRVPWLISIFLIFTFFYYYFVGGFTLSFNPIALTLLATSLCTSKHHVALRVVSLRRSPLHFGAPMIPGCLSASWCWLMYHSVWETWRKGCVGEGVFTGKPLQ